MSFVVVILSVTIIYHINIISVHNFHYNEHFKLTVFIYSPSLSNLLHFEFGQRLGISRSVLGISNSDDCRCDYSKYKGTDGKVEK